MEDNKNINKEDTHKESHKKHIDTPIILIFGCALVLIAFVIGWQSSKMSPNKANVVADSSSSYTNDSDYSKDNNVDPSEDVTMEGEESYASPPANPYDDYVGKYHVGIQSTALRYLTINSDGTARYTDSVYTLKYSLLQDFDGEWHTYTDDGFNTLEEIESIKVREKEKVKILKIGKKPLIKAAYSWDIYSDSRIGSYLMLTKSNGDRSYIKDGYWYNNFNAMRSFDEDRRATLKRVK